MTLTKSNKGFTLIELLVVVAILGLLATIIAVSLTGARSRARDSRRASDIRQFELALELYYSANLQYPDQLSDLLGGGGAPSYLNVSALPVDPTGNSYYYVVGQEDANTAHPYQYFHVAAELENDDSDLLANDFDGDSTIAPSGVTWDPGTVGVRPSCETGSGGFNADENDTGAPCATAGVSLYDRGVFPQQ